MKINRNGSASWQGGFKEGRGALSTQSGALKEHPYGYASRFDGVAGSNPEELIGAAHAGCFTMSLAAVLGGAGLVAQHMATVAVPERHEIVPVEVEQIEGHVNERAFAPLEVAEAGPAGLVEGHDLAVDNTAAGIEAVAHLAQGRAVFVDFTAAWCVSCQVNKKLVLDTESGRQAFAKAGVALMRADWTNRDPRITQALAELGRSGVPVYVLHRPGKAPLLLPEVLTPGLLQEALGTL